jgi:hypothetical protein
MEIVNFESERTAGENGKCRTLAMRLVKRAAPPFNT